MYTVPQYQPRIRFIGNDGSVLIYNNYQEFIESISYHFIERHIVTTMKEWPNSWFIHWKIGDSRYPKYIVRDEFGSVFSPIEIFHDKNKFVISNRKQKYKRYNKRYDFIFRSTPVPHTGKRRCHFGSWYKNPRTTQEKRWGYAYREFTRGKRRPHILPSIWDDIIRSDVRIRKSWKNQKKKKQWM